MNKKEGKCIDCGKELEIQRIRSVEIKRTIDIKQDKEFMGGYSKK